MIWLVIQKTSTLTNISVIGHWQWFCLWTRAVSQEALNPSSVWQRYASSTYTASLTSSVLEYRKENGRTYHGYRDGSKSCLKAYCLKILLSQKVTWCQMMRLNWIDWIWCMKCIWQSWIENCFLRPLDPHHNVFMILLPVLEFGLYSLVSWSWGVWDF